MTKPKLDKYLFEATKSESVFETMNAASRYFDENLHERLNFEISEFLISVIKRSFENIDACHILIKGRDVDSYDPVPNVLGSILRSQIDILCAIYSTLISKDPRIMCANVLYKNKEIQDHKCLKNNKMRDAYLVREMASDEDLIWAFNLTLNKMVLNKNFKKFTFFQDPLFIREIEYIYKITNKMVHFSKYRHLYDLSNYFINKGERKEDFFKIKNDERKIDLKFFNENLILKYIQKLTTVFIVMILNYDLLANKKSSFSNYEKITGDIPLSIRFLILNNIDKMLEKGFAKKVSDNLIVIDKKFIKTLNIDGFQNRTLIVSKETLISLGAHK